MVLLKITKTFTFDAGHRLSDYEGKCRRLHGHTYTLWLTVEGDLNTLGMVMDFGDLKDLFKDLIDSKFDHKMMLKNGDPINEAIRGVLPETDDSICWLEYNPTAENIVSDIVGMIKDKLPEGVKLVRAKLYETPTSFAEIEL